MRCGFVAWVGKIPGGEHATHSSILAWRIAWTEETGGLQFMGLQSQARLKQLSKHTRREKLYVTVTTENI